MGSATYSTERRDNILVGNRTLAWIGVFFFLALGLVLAPSARREGRSLSGCLLLATALSSLLLAMYFTAVWFGALQGDVRKVFVLVAVVAVAGLIALSIVVRRQNR